MDPTIMSIMKPTPVSTPNESVKIMTGAGTYPDPQTEPESNRRSTFMFKFGPIISDSMQEFARIHKHDSRVNFRDNFDNWYQKNSELISREENRIENMGYTDDIKVKMFRSIKYYYIKKNRMKLSNPLPTTETHPSIVTDTPTHDDVVTTSHGMSRGKVRPEKYIQHQQSFKDTINQYVLERCIPTGKSPKDGYAAFVIDNLDVVETETLALIDKYNLTTEDASSKIKKTFKNQHFQHNRKY